MIVFRVENHIGEGPYACSYMDRSWCTKRHDNNPKTPRPDESFTYTDWLSVTSKHVYGFISLKDLYNWFSKRELRNLRAHGFRIKCFHVNREDVIIGKKQLAFKR